MKTTGLSKKVNTEQSISSFPRFC